MIRYYLEANCGYAEYKVKLDIQKVKDVFQRETDFANKYFSNLPTIFSVLVEYAIDYGKEKTDISSSVGDYDPYLTLIYVSQKDFEILKEAFPNESFEDINVE